MNATHRYALALIATLALVTTGCSQPKPAPAEAAPPAPPATSTATAPARASDPVPATAPTAASSAPPTTAPATAPAVTPPDDRPQKDNVKPTADLPAGITIDVENRLVRLDGKVVLREGWLELLACTPGTKEHESIVTVQAPPSVIHFALLTVGAEPGSPIRIEPQGEELVAIPPSGAVIAIDITYDQGDQRVTVPANQWVYNEATQTVMADNRWVFAGSKLREFEEGPVYLADLEGSAVSVVNFGSELLAKPNRLTDSNAVHGENFVVNTELIPPLRTPVVLTLRVVDPAPAPVAMPATQPASH